MSVSDWGLPGTNPSPRVRDQMWPLIAGVGDEAVVAHGTVSIVTGDIDGSVWVALFDVAQWNADRTAL